MVIGVSWDHRNDVRTRTSKALSYILRHGGTAVGLTFDEEGFATVDDALRALYVLGRIHAQLTRADLLAVVDDPSNPRFERRGDRIRARYGHSAASVAPPADEEPEAAPSPPPPAPALVPETPPAVLYHGTSKEAADQILAGAGLGPRTRQYVHLSADRDEARRVGRRHAEHPVILRIDALRAAEAGVEFGRAAERTWLTPHVPAEYIRVEQPAVEPSSSQAGPRGASPAGERTQARRQRGPHQEEQAAEARTRQAGPPSPSPKRTAQAPVGQRPGAPARPRGPEPPRTGQPASDTGPDDASSRRPASPPPGQQGSRRAAAHHRRHRSR